MLAATPRDPGGRPGNLSHDATGWPRLADLGVTRSESSRWQQIASIPEQDFEAYVASTVEAQRELTTPGALKLAKKLRGRASSLHRSTRSSPG